MADQTTQTQTDDAAPGTVTLGDWVRVDNVGDDRVVIQWDSRVYRINPGESKFVPFEAAKLWFGDPRSSGNVASTRDVTGLVSWIPDRATEVRRLRALYDNQFGDERVIANHPHVEVYTQQGDRVYTVLDDPDGERTSPAVQSVMDHASLLEQVKRQQATIDLLVQQAGIGTGPARVENDAIPEDEDVADNANEDVVLDDQPQMTDTLPPDDFLGANDSTNYDRTPRADDAGA